MHKIYLLVSICLLSLGATHPTMAGNTSGKELAVYCNPQNEADGDALAKALLTNTLASAEQHNIGASKWIACETYMDGFIRGYNMAFQMGMGFTEYHLKQDHQIAVDDAEMRRKAAQELGLWYLCLPNPHSSALEAHVVSDYLTKHPQAFTELSEDAVKEAFAAAFTKPDGGCR